MDGCFFRGAADKEVVLCLGTIGMLSIIIAANTYIELIMCQPCSMDFGYTKLFSPHNSVYKESTIIIISLGLEVTHWHHGLPP